MKSTLRFFLFVLLSFSWIVFSAQAAKKNSTITIRGVSYQLSIMQTEASRAQGLSNQQYLPKNAGMLFVFQQQGKYGFWMKDMLFPIDIIFIDNRKIVSIVHSAPIPKPGEQLFELPIYNPISPVNYVLEVNAGEANKHHFKRGDEVTIN